MTSTFHIASIVYAVIMVASAIYDFTKPADLIADIARWGYKPGFEVKLGLIKLVGAAGLLIGLKYDYVGLAAVIGFTIYFALAVATHFKVKDPAHKHAPAFALWAVALGLFFTAVMTVTK